MTTISLYKQQKQKASQRILEDLTNIHHTYNGFLSFIHQFPYLVNKEVPQGLEEDLLEIWQDMGKGVNIQGKCRNCALEFPLYKMIQKSGKKYCKGCDDELSMEFN